MTPIHNISSLLSEFRKEFRHCSCELWEGNAKPSKVEEFIQSHISSLLDELGVEEIRNRFRCAKCDGSKCEHTLTCKALSEVQDKISQAKL